MFFWHLHYIIWMIPSEDPLHLKAAVSERNGAFFRNIYGNGMSKCTSWPISNWSNCNIIGTVCSKNGTIAHIHPSLAITGNPLRLERVSYLILIKRLPETYTFRLGGFLKEGFRKIEEWKTITNNCRWDDKRNCLKL